MTTKRMWLSAGACAIAAAITVSPVMALADDGTDNTGGSSSSTDGVGDSAGAPNPAKTNRGGVSRAGAAANAAAANADNSPAAPGRGANAKAAVDAQATTGSRPLFQNPLWWFGTPNPTPPPPAYTRTFEPLANLPGWSQDYYGWYRNMDFEACVLGVGTTITQSVGPYGTGTNSVSTGGC